MDENPNDANPLETPSPSNEPGLESPAPTKEPAAEPTLAEVAQAAYDKATSSQEEPDGDVPNKDKTAADAEPIVEEPIVADLDAELPFHEHPRWQEVKKKADEAETKVKELTERQQNYDSYAQRVQYHDAFVAEHNISPDDFNQVMNILALKNSDPSRARELLKPMWESLAAYDENVIPLEVQREISELEQKVKDSEISRPLADRQIALLKETAKAKANRQANERRTQMTAEQRQRSVAINIGQTLQSWETTMAKKDPSFKPKAKPESRDGVYELTVAKYTYLANQKPPQNGAEASALAERALKESKEIFAPVARQVQARPQITSQRSSTARRNGEPETIADTVAAVARKHGYSWSPTRK